MFYLDIISLKVRYSHLNRNCSCIFQILCVDIDHKCFIGSLTLWLLSGQLFLCRTRSCLYYVSYSERFKKRQYKVLSFFLFLAKLFNANKQFLYDHQENTVKMIRESERRK